MVRWIAAVVALVAGLVLGAGTVGAGAAVHTSTSTVHPVTHTGGMHPNDWWW